MGSAAFPYEKKEVLGHTMAYVDVGAGDPIVFLHGNPTSSYLWRNAIPHLQGLGRCRALNLIGMGDLAKLPDSGPSSYTFVEHRRYVDALLAALGMHERGIHRSASGHSVTTRRPARRVHQMRRQLPLQLRKEHKHDHSGEHTQF